MTAHYGLDSTTRAFCVICNTLFYDMPPKDAMERGANSTATAYGDRRYLRDLKLWEYAIYPPLVDTIRHLQGAERRLTWPNRPGLCVPCNQVWRVAMDAGTYYRGQNPNPVIVIPLRVSRS